MRRTLAAALTVGLTAVAAAGPVATASAALVRGSAPVRGSALASPAWHRGRLVLKITSTSPVATRLLVSASGSFSASGQYRPGRRVSTVGFPQGRIEISHHVISTSPSVPTPPSCRFTIVQRGTFSIEKGTKSYRGIRGSGTYSTTIRARLGRSHGLCTSKIVAYHSTTYDRGTVFGIH